VRNRLYALSLTILIVGLCSATAIYFLSDEVEDAGDGYVIVDGQKYPGGFYQSKRYQRDLERYGGKANVIFDELNRWFASLWHGKRLGITLAWISVIASLVIFLLARYLYPKRDS
jgi:hypothetical protein